MIYILKNLNIFVNKKNKLLLYFLIFLSFVSSFLEMISIGIIPLVISIYLKTGFFYESLPTKILNYVDDLEVGNFLIISSILIIVVFCLKNFLLYQINKLYLMILNNITAKTTIKVYENFIKKDFVKFKRYSLGEKLRDLTTEANNSTVAIMQVFLIIQDILTLTFILFLIFYSSSNLILLLLFSLFIISLIFMKVYGNKLKNIGSALIASRKNLFKQIYETSNLIREIKIYSNYNFFLNKFKIEHSKLIQRNLRRLLITSMPKYFLEISTVIFIFLIIYFEIEVEKKKISELITVLALLIISSLRVLPIVNSSVQKISNLKTLNVSFSLVLEILNSHQNNLDYPTTIISNDSKNFDCILEFKEFSFNYGKDVIFEKQNIKIFKQSIIGIYGKSGGGKSTVLDLLCGIIQPSEGDIFFKNNKVNQISDVDLNIALVSQNSQLLNLTIAENIAFGVQKEKIDRNSIQSIIELVGLKDFILNKKEGLDFIIDDNSGNLSGGQIQRLSIARALYRQPELLLLDEPTSSLDEKNSKNIKNLIYNLRNLTRSIIIVSHDKDLLDKCDYIYEIKNNKIILS